MAVKEKIRIRLKGYDHNVVDKAAEKIVETAREFIRSVGGFEKFAEWGLV